jgi:ribosomal protein S18 acetylase RimI-like enzyme
MQALKCPQYNALDIAEVYGRFGHKLRKRSSKRGRSMDIKIIKIHEGEMKSFYAEKVLRRLPEWFGNEKALCDYVIGVADLPFWAAIDRDGNCIGFISIKIHYGTTGDVYVCGVLPEYHRKGIGKKLMNSAEDYLKQSGCKYVIVKTLSEIADYEPYERTRKFYLKVGFEPLITIKEIWDEENPCLIMIKRI